MVGEIRVMDITAVGGLICADDGGRSVWQLME